MFTLGSYLPTYLRIMLIKTLDQFTLNGCDKNLCEPGLQFD